MPILASDLLSVSDAAHQKGCTTQTIYNAVERGALTGVRVGSTRLVALDAKWEAYAVQETGGRLHRAYRDRQEAEEA